MKWNKKGLIYDASAYKTEWASHSALTPTPLLISDDVIRVFFGARDDNGVSRIRYLDVNANNPKEILNVSNTPSLDVGQPGTFDDNGVILGDVILFENKLYLFYVGFQLVNNVKFLAFTGLAISEDYGVSFTRCNTTPILDRSEEGHFIRAVHSVIYENGIWRIWYAAGSEWYEINKTPYPSYYIKYLEGTDLNNLPKIGQTCISFSETEYRIGRPRVYQTADGYEMYYTKGDKLNNYLAGYAASHDGLDWHRHDRLIGIHTSADGWDSKSVIYPALITNKSEQTFMFYNGNDMGSDGFGFAKYVLED